MRIVLDTNVLVSGLLQPLGPSGRIVRLVASGDLELAFDARILEEYRVVLARPRFAFETGRVAAILAQIRSAGLPIAAPPWPDPLPDPDDAPFLEVALAAEVSCLVTGNQKHFPVESRGLVQVLNPREFVETLRSGESTRAKNE